jgi:type II secretory pathway pseudopilin PulG
MARTRIGIPAGVRGISLVEALIAIAIVLGTLGVMMPLLIWSQRAARTASSTSIGVLLASEKLHQLRGLTWHVGSAAEAVADLATDLSSDPPADGGAGLAPTGAGTLTGNRSGYVDYLDEHGLRVGAGPTAPSRTRFVRRWAIAAHPADPSHSVVLHVLVLPASVQGRAASGHPHAVHLSSIRTRLQP